MSNGLTSPKIIAISLTVLLFASVVWLMNEKKVNSSLEEGLNSEKLRTESLLSEKLLLEKDMAKFKEQISSLSGKNQDLDKVLKQTSSKLEASEVQYNKVSKENASLQKVRKQHSELLAIRKDLEKQLETLSASIQNLQAENKNLNNTVASLEQRNSLLNDELRKAMLASVDNSQIDGLKGSERLTVKASRTKKLVANFEVPAELKNLSYRVIDPNGKALTPKDGAITSRVVSNADSYTASASTANLVGVSSRLSKVEMTYIPTKKLVAGSYKVEILNDNLYVGSLQIRFR